jgi:hypothetical protein
MAADMRPRSSLPPGVVATFVVASLSRLPLPRLRVPTARLRFQAVQFYLKRPNSLALLLGISLFDQTKLLPRGVPPCLIVGKKMVTAICRSAHQIHGLLTKLIAIQRYVVAVAERLPLRL